MLNTTNVNPLCKVNTGLILFVVHIITHYPVTLQKPVVLCGSWCPHMNMKGLTRKAAEKRTVLGLSPRKNPLGKILLPL